MPGRLGIMSRPRGGDWLDDEIRRLRQHGVQVLVSLLEPAEVEELDLLREPEVAVSEAIVYLSFPIPDRGVPGDALQFHRLVQEVGDHVASGASVVIHCRAGIGRSSMLAACVLAGRGASLDEAFRILSAARGLPVPDTHEQRDWAERFIGSHPQRPHTARGSGP